VNNKGTHVHTSNNSADGNINFVHHSDINSHNVILFINLVSIVNYFL